MRTTLLAASAVAASLAIPTLPPGAHGQALPPAAGQPAEGQPAPAGSPTVTAGAITESELREYARARRALEENPNVAMVLRQPETLQMQALERYLPRTGVGLRAQDYIRIDRAVRSNPVLEGQVVSGQITGAGTQARQEQVSESQLQDYMRIRRQIDQETNAAMVLRLPDDQRRQALDRYLRRNASAMTADEFIRLDQIVQNDPQLRARIEAGGSASGASGTQAPAMPAPATQAPATSASPQ